MQPVFAGAYIALAPCVAPDNSLPQNATTGQSNLDMAGYPLRGLVDCRRCPLLITDGRAGITCSAQVRDDVGQLAVQERQDGK